MSLGATEGATSSTATPGSHCVRQSQPITCLPLHELSIAICLVELACEEASRRHLRHVQALHVRVGPFSGVVKEALFFSFDLAAAGTPIEGATLKVEETRGAELELFALEVPE